MNLHELWYYLKQKVNRKEWKLFREGPSHVQKELWFDVVVEWELDWKHVFAKWYTDNSREYYFHELDFANKINEFAQLHSDYQISGTEVLDHNDEHNYFVMRAVQEPKLDVKTLSLDEVFVLQSRITWFFAALKQHFDLPYFVGWHEKDKYADLVQFFAWKKQVDDSWVKKLFEGMIRLIKSRVANWEKYGFIQEIVSYDKDSIFRKIDDFASHVSLQNALCDSIGILRDGHVYGNINDKLILIDFDRLIPSLNGYDFMALLFSKLGLNSYIYSDYHEYKKAFFEIKQLLEKHIADKNLVSFLLIQKLLGTIFNDYGWLLLEKESHREYFAKSDISPEENSKRGIIRNFQIMHELFNLDYVSWKSIF